MALNSKPALIAIFAGFLMFVSINRLSAENYEPSTFKKVYLESFKTLKKHLSNVQVRMLHDRGDHVTKNTYLILEDRFQSRTEYQTSRPLAGTPPYLRIRSLDGNRIFDIQQHSKTDPYTKVSFDKAIHRRESKWSKPYALAAYYIMNASLEELFRDRSTKIVSVSLAEDRAGLLKVVLDVSPEKFKFHHVELYLNPEENMAIFEYQAKATFNLHGFGRIENVEYQAVMLYDTPMRVPVPREVVIGSTSFVNGLLASRHIERAERTGLQVGEGKASQFTLEHFGLNAAPDITR